MTPTDDLRARHWNAIRALLTDYKNALAIIAKREDGPVESRISKDAEEAIAALSALPAGGDSDAWRGLYRLERAMRFMDNNAELTKERAFKMADEDVAAMEKQLLATTPPPDAAVGAQGQPVAGDGIRAATPEEEAAIDAALGYTKLTIRLPRDLLAAVDEAAAREGLIRVAMIRKLVRRGLEAAAPAAGKGVDDAQQVIAHLRDIADVAERYTVEELRDVLRERATELETALTRQPVAGDGPKESQA